MPNNLWSAAGSLKQARALVIQPVQQMKVTSANCDDVMELLGFCQKIGSLQATMESIANRYGENENHLSEAAANAGRRGSAARA